VSSAYDLIVLLSRARVCVCVCVCACAFARKLASPVEKCNICFTSNLLNDDDVGNLNYYGALHFVNGNPP
jgi:hypothetical protein